MSAVLMTMLDAICIGLAGGALMALLLDIIGRESAPAKLPKKSRPRLPFRGVSHLPHFNTKFRKYEEN
jgi:hypothetical protein